MMKGITSGIFGTLPDGQTVRRFTITNDAGARVSVLDWGVTLTEIQVPDKSGALRDVCLGYATLGEYEKNGGYLGATVGRCANRIAGSRFSLDGREYSLYPNDGPNHLHGGKKGFNRFVWEHRIEGEKLVFTRLSPDGEEGYPGNLEVQVAVGFTDAGELVLDYTAHTDGKTIVNLTNHTYFNLEGQDSGSVMGHKLTLAADGYTPADAGLIPTGETVPVAGTPFDFTQARTIGSRLDDPALAATGGYDHNFSIRGAGLREAARLEAPDSGIVMTVRTDLPGIQVYTANGLSGVLSKTGRPYGRHGAVCLETQYFPNAVNTPGFASPVLEAGGVFRSRTAYQFGIAD